MNLNISKFPLFSFTYHVLGSDYETFNSAQLDSDSQQCDRNVHVLN